MPWSELTTGTPQLTLKATGKVEWNIALQILLGNPSWVQLMWDTDTNRLGIRGIYAQMGWPVEVLPEESVYKIHCADALDAAGVPVDDDVSGEPMKWTGVDDWIPDQPTYYINLP